MDTVLIKGKVQNSSLLHETKLKTHHDPHASQRTSPVQNDLALGPAFLLDLVSRRPTRTFVTQRQMHGMEEGVLASNGGHSWTRARRNRCRH